MSIQSLVLRKCASVSSSGLPVNSGLKWGQFNWGIGPGWIGCADWTTVYAGGASYCTGGAGGTTGDITVGGWGAGGPPSTIAIYVVDCVTNI